jgi:Na+/H+ antiporter NhaB
MFTLCTIFFSVLYFILTSDLLSKDVQSLLKLSSLVQLPLSEGTLFCISGTISMFNIYIYIKKKKALLPLLGISLSPNELHLAVAFPNVVHVYDITQLSRGVAQVL